MASMCSLAQHTADGWSTKFVGARIGADAMETWSRGLEQFNSARAKYGAAQFYDVDYRELISDPIGTVIDIYRKFEIPLTDEARQAMEDSHAESQTGARAPKHTYSLADYGLTAGGCQGALRRALIDQQQATRRRLGESWSTASRHPSATACSMLSASFGQALVRALSVPVARCSAK